MKKLILLALSLAALTGTAQELVSSGTSIESCNDQKNCLTVDNVSYLFYDETRGEFYLKVDFSKFRTENDTTDNWLNDHIDSLLYFKAILLKEDFPVLSNSNTKTLALNGRIFYAGVWKDQSVSLSIFSTENSIVPATNGNRTGNTRYDNYKVSFSIPFVPKDFKTYKKLYYNNQTVDITMTLGRINYLAPGMEFHLKEVYYQSTR